MTKATPENQLILPTSLGYHHRNAILTSKLNKMRAEGILEDTIQEIVLEFYVNELVLAYARIEGATDDAIYNDPKIIDHFDMLDIEIEKEE